MDCYIGMVVLWPRNQVPDNWLFCEGQTLSINQYNTLFSVIGTTYGGDGVSNFKLPDLRSRVLIGMGQGEGLTNRALGQTGGNEAVILATQNLPTHNHGFMVSNDTAVAPSYVPNQDASSFIGIAKTVVTPPADKNLYDTVGSGATSSSLTALNSATIGTCAGGSAHSNIQPSIALHYMICTQGYYPSRS